MKNFLQVIIFSVVVIWFYTIFADKYIPPINPAPPPKEEVLDLGAMTMDQFIALGEKVYHGKGTCELCHNPVGGRAPLLDQVAVVAAERLADERYKGEATNAEEYIYESMVNPSAYVVAGFGVTGTNDTESPMPDVSTGAIGLNEAELRAVIAYLQDMAGQEVTVKIPEGTPEEGGGEEEAAAAPAATGEEAVAKYGCNACHKIGGKGGEIGPDLSSIGAERDESYIRRAIIDPNADVAEGYPAGMMPDTYKDQMTAGELELVVQLLAQSK
ncbi:MAG TPA: c-type cytochrome [Deltaproteobacteria bacterium]|nr:c-type cytochrome [Deltaproteobacteria bacterium]